jgi:nucleoside-diphosphate-sugar epimerase
MLVIGARTHLGRALADTIAKGWRDEGSLVSRVLASSSKRSVGTSKEQADVGISYENVSKIISPQFDLIIHAASPTSIEAMTASGYRDRLWQTNVGLMSSAVRLAEMSAEALGRSVPIVFLSSREVYLGLRGRAKAREDQVGRFDSRNGRNIYAMSKALSEALLLASATDNLVKPIILRIGHVYGPLMNLTDGRVLGSLFRGAVSRSVVAFHGEGAALLQPLLIDDFVMAARAALAHGGHPILNVAHPDLVPIHEIASLLASGAGKRAVSQTRVPGSASGYLQDPPPALDTSLLQSLGWKPSFDHSGGLTYVLRLLLRDNQRQQADTNDRP